MSKSRQIVLSEKNLELFEALAKKYGGAEEVRADPNFVLSLMFEQLEEGKSGPVSAALRWSLDPDHIQGARSRRATGAKAA